MVTGFANGDYKFKYDFVNQVDHQSVENKLNHNDTKIKTQPAEQRQIWMIGAVCAIFAMEMINRRERLPFPSPFYIPEVMDAQVQQIEALINQLLVEEPSYFLVSLKIKPTNNIKVFMDGDEGISIEKCVKFNRQLYKLIEEKGWYPEGEFSLELSSPGIEEPLLFNRQYHRNMGRSLEILFLDGTTKEGKLVAVTEADILLETTEGKGKKAITQQLLIPFNNIKTTTVQIKF